MNDLTSEGRLLAGTDWTHYSPTHTQGCKMFMSVSVYVTEISVMTVDVRVWKEVTARQWEHSEAVQRALFVYIQIMFFFLFRLCPCYTHISIKVYI